jgi:pyroglutamyl-peptidase
VSILLTGFSPWGKERVNPSGVIAAALGGHVLPVEYGPCVRELRKLIARGRPHAIVLMGLASGRRRISLEAVALNVDHYEGPGKNRAWRRPVRRGAALAIGARLPLDKILERLRQARIPSAISHHAGTYVCNHLFYEALAATTVPCGFIHLPPFRAVSKARQLKAVRLALEALGGSSRAATR